jgi:3-oxoacid CoA-transferase subunit B
MEHNANDGSHKIVEEFSLPYTARPVVQRIITDLCVLDVTDNGLKLAHAAKGDRSTLPTRPRPSKAAK